MNIALTLTQSLNHLAGNILLTDAAGVATYANEGITKRTGFSIAEIIGAKPGHLWGGHMPKIFYDRLWQSLRAHQTPFASTVSNRTKHGERYEDLLAVTPLRKADGTVMYLALRPPKLEDQSRFLNEWGGIFCERMPSAAVVLPWLHRWFPSDVLVQSQQPGTFADWTETNWVSELRTRFQSRLDDRELILAAQHDPRQFSRLYDKYHSLVRQYYSRHLSGQADQVQDLTQDTFVRALERLDGYEVRNAAYGTYLLRIAHNILLNTYRHKAMFELSPDLASLRKESSAELAWIWETPELSPRERLVLSAYYREGFSVREISRGLEITENATKLLLSRARKKIRHLLTSS